MQVRWCNDSGSFYLQFPQQYGHTEAVLMLRAKGPVFNRGGRISVRHFAVYITTKICYCKVSMCVSTAQACTKRAPRNWGSSFSFKFPHERALVKCPRAFRLHQLPKSVLPALGISFPPLYSHMRAFLCVLLCSVG